MDSIMYMVLLVLLGAAALPWYAQSKLKNKLLCTFRRANKTKVEKLIPLKSKYVIFDGGKYNVNPKRISLFWFNRGIHQFFPTWLPTLDYNYNSRNPLDPGTFEDSWDTPEAREASEQEDSWKAFSKGVQAQIGKASRFPEWLFPAITIGAVAVIGYLVYQQGQHLSYLEQLIKLGLQGG